MIRTVPDDGIIAYNLTSNDIKPTEHLKTGSVIFEVDTQDKYFFDEESKQWYKYTGPWLNFYTKINEETYCFFGLAKDTKPEGFGIGSMFVEVDASKAYILSDDGWKEAEEPGPTPPGPTPKPTLQDKTVDPTTNAQQVTYDSGYDGLGTVNITAVTNTIDNNIKAENIKKDIAILGVLGAYEPVIPVPSLQDKTVAPKTTEQIVHADEAYDGLDEVTVSAVTSSIDNNIQAANIKKGVTILGVVGTYGGAQPTPIDIDCTFDESGQPESADVFVYGDKLGPASGTFIIDGVDYSNNNLKINSYPLVNFHTDGPTIVEIYIAPLTTASTNIKVDNELQDLPTDEQGNPIAGIVTVTTLPAGCHTILRGGKETALCRLKVTHVDLNN